MHHHKFSLGVCNCGLRQNGTRLFDDTPRMNTRSKLYCGKCGIMLDTLKDKARHDDFTHAPEFVQRLRAAGWYVHHKPEPMMKALGLGEWIFRQRKDTLNHLFIVEETGEWWWRRFTREPFGDYTNVFQPKGKGVGYATLFETVNQAEGQPE